jgi:hypothetical protein
LADLAKFSARLAGWGSVGLGGLVLVRPKQLGKVLGIDTTKGAGMALTFALAVRDMAIGLYLVRAKDTKGLRQGLLYRMVAETSDTLMTGLGRGVIRQPAGRKLAMTIPPLILIEWLIRQNLKD